MSNENKLCKRVYSTMSREKCENLCLRYLNGGNWQLFYRKQIRGEDSVTCPITVFVGGTNLYRSFKSFKELFRSIKAGLLRPSTNDSLLTSSYESVEEIEVELDAAGVTLDGCYYNWLNEFTFMDGSTEERWEYIFHK